MRAEELREQEERGTKASRPSRGTMHEAQAEKLLYPREEEAAPCCIRRLLHPAEKVEVQQGQQVQKDAGSLQPHGDDACTGL